MSKRLKRPTIRSILTEVSLRRYGKKPPCGAFSKDLKPPQPVDAPLSDLEAAHLKLALMRELDAIEVQYKN